MLTKNDFETKYIIIHDNNYKNAYIYEYCVDDIDFEKEIESCKKYKIVKKVNSKNEFIEYVKRNVISIKSVNLIDDNQKFDNSLNQGDKLFLYNELSKYIINELEIKKISLMMYFDVEKNNLSPEIIFFLENKNKKIKVVSSYKLLKENKYKYFVDLEKIEDNNIKNYNLYFFFDKESAISKLEEYEEILLKRLKEVEATKNQLIDYEFSNSYNA